MYICYCNSRIYFLVAQLSLIILTPWTREDQALLPMEFSRQEYQSGVPFPTPYVVVPVQLLSRVWLFATPWTAALQASLSITFSWSLLKFMSIELVMLSNHLHMYVVHNIYIYVLCSLIYSLIYVYIYLNFFGTIEIVCKASRQMFPD